MGEHLLYHAGFQIIEHPDLKIGRKNADFGQGFYLSDKEAFSKRWARTRKDQITYLNRYAMDYTNLSIKYFERNEEWYDYIRQNRSGCPDSLASYDIIIGPIANDTIYNLAGITTSGFLDKEKALGILMIGPEYKQITIKTEKAANALQFIDAVEITKEEIGIYRELVSKEEQDFQVQVGKMLR